MGRQENTAGLPFWVTITGAPDSASFRSHLAAWALNSLTGTKFSETRTARDNLVELLAQLGKNGVAIVKGLEQHENGKFAWIMDPDGNKVELWEPMASDEKKRQP